MLACQHEPLQQQSSMKSPVQGFNRALEPALLARWRVTSHNLAELCRGGPLNPRAQFGIRRSFCCCVAPSVPRQLAEALYEASSQHLG